MMKTGGFHDGSRGQIGVDPNGSVKPIAIDFPLPLYSFQLSMLASIASDLLELLEAF